MGRLLFPTNFEKSFEIGTVLRMLNILLELL